MQFVERFNMDTENTYENVKDSSTKDEDQYNESIEAHGDMENVDYGKSEGTQSDFQE